MNTNAYHHIVKWCAAEVHRQKATPLHVAGMFEAWDYLFGLSADLNRDLGQMDLLVMERCITLSPGPRIHPWRTTPATFDNGRKAAIAWQHVERQMDLWLDEWNNGTILTAGTLTKLFLDIHPYEDGNGRLAALLWNWRNRTLSNPLPLPDFYQEAS